MSEQKTILPACAAAFSYAAFPAATAADLRKKAAQIREQVKVTTAAIISVGTNLIAVKEKLVHGKFSDWVVGECGFGLRSAENYIRAALFAEGKTETVALLPPATVYRLAAKSAPPDIVKAVLDRVESGARVTSGEVDAALADARHQRREQARKIQQAERQKKVSKSALAKREKSKRDEEARLQKEVERRCRVVASIFDTLGDEHVKFLLDAVPPMDGWQIIDLLRVEFRCRHEKSDRHSQGRGDTGASASMNS